MPSIPLKIARFDPSPFGFPKPKVPLLAHRSPRGDGHGRTQELGGAFRSYTRGRYALCEAYRLSGVQRGTTLLAPAYHCVTMIDPAISLDADVRLYPLNPDLSPDLDRLDAVFASALGPVKALLATHYFGLVQDFTRLKAWCDARQITLVEDCSHVLYTGTFRARGAGEFGRYVTSSPYKFFSCEDGGLLHAADGHLLDDVRTQPPGLVAEVRGIKRALEKRWSDGKAPDVEQTLKQLSQLAERPLPATELRCSEYARPSPYYNRAESGKAALRSSRWRTRATAASSIASQRQRNYRRWLDTVIGLPNCRPLYPTLPDDAVPYMFPLLVNDPDPHFFWLKHLGMPIWRWDDMAVSDCSVAQHCQLHLLHLPCHQGLDAAQLEWMTRTVSAVMSRSATRNR